MTLGEIRQPYIMKKLFFRYPNVSFRQSGGEYRIVSSIKTHFQKLFLSALIFHHSKAGYPHGRWLAIPNVNIQFSEKGWGGIMKDKHTGAKNNERPAG